ncbi:APC family permease [Sulfurisphaera tokodaii]|uniref:APC family transporter n=2 Tax=Sulfurisphaera tokodaii TaxID=111955 RepID=Q96Y07_SULTO|nr:APC family permease [Sulfurisphaera tokodaii]BAB67470.1 putative APC family transporter [Sulfurisphaera tokodaii str. 7]HII75180.1 APC family permease [Sulfurisphaera tokodaii]
MGLAKGSLSIREAYGQAMAVTAPLGSVVSTTTAAITYAGKAVVFATVLALIGSALWIYTLTRYSSKIASAGGYYTYGAAAWRKKTLAYYEAVIEVIAYSALNAVNALAIYLLVQTYSQIVNVTIPAYILYLFIALGLLYPTIISFTTHIRSLLGKIVSVSATLEVIMLYAMFIYAVATKGFNLSYFSPSGASLSAIGTAMILSIVSISGAGASTYLGEESKVPRKTITFGMWLSLVIGGSAILAGTYGLVALWNGSLTSLENSNQPLIQELFAFGLPIVMIGLLMSINSLLASNIGTTVGSARVLFNLAREKAMPKLFEKTNRTQEPIMATMFVGILSALFTIFSIIITGSVQNAFNEISVVTSVFWLAGRIIDGFGVPVFYWRINSLSLPVLIIPISATLINTTGVILSFQTPDVFQSLSILVILLSATVWYIAKARKGLAGTYVVDDNNELISIDEYIEKLKKEKVLTSQT